jgi:FkbM family methyltransferase
MGKLREAANRIGVLRRLRVSAPVQHLVRTGRAARAVHEPVRFFALQLCPPRTAGYRLRSSGLRVYLRHRTRDIDVFKEIFGPGYGANSYEAPAHVAAALDAKSAPRVIDLGGNIGLFGVYVLGRWPRASIRSFEPDPTNLPILERVLAANQLSERWTVRDVAVANSDGELPFVAGLLAESQLVGVIDQGALEAESASLADGHSIVVRTIDLFDQDHDVDLMKIDIEGGEWSILSDPRMKELKAEALVLEWHANGSPDPRTEALELLQSAGYTAVHETEVYDYRGLLWAWREAPVTSDSSA